MPNANSLIIEGMDCPSCTSKIEGAVCALPGIKNVKLNYTTQKLKFDLYDDAADPAVVTNAIEKLGYKVKLGDTPSVEQAWWQTGKGKLVIIAGILLTFAAVLSYWQPAYGAYVFAAAALGALYPLARKAWFSALAGQPFTIETLVTIAVIGAIFIGEQAEAAVVVFLFLIGELLEMIAAAKARHSVQALADLVPKSALLVIEGGIRKVDAASLSIGDIIETRPGDRVAADGIIIEGQSAINEAAITGESMPVNKMPGDSIFAGSINTDGLIRLRIEKTVENNMISRILQMVEDATASKAPTARFIDDFSRYYTPGVIVVSALIAFVPPVFFDGDMMVWIYKALAILLIGCPCALVLSTPAAITSGISAGAKHGLLMKGGAVLEAIGRVSQVAFDKTGTLTEGRPKVTDIHVFSGSEAQLLMLAGSVEAGSSHPLAIAIVEKANTDKIALTKATDLEALNGRGVKARINGKEVIIASPRHAGEITTLSARISDLVQTLEEEGKTIALTIVDGKIIGLFALRDELRKDAKAAMGELKKMGIKPIMLTGDNKRTGAAIAGQLGINVKAELLPQQKLDEIKQLRQTGNIAMVGDGINDAPALALADVGIAMGGGTDVALETADAALLHNRLSDVPQLILLSRATMRNIHQNISIALGLKAILLATTLLGMTSLWMAILADTGATILVTLNALRLLGYRFKN